MIPEHPEATPLENPHRPPVSMDVTMVGDDPEPTSLPIEKGGRKRPWSTLGKQTRKRHKELEVRSIRQPAPYDLDFNTFGNAAIEDLRTFIRTLDKSAHWAVTRSRIIENLQKEEPRGVLPLLLKIYNTPFDEDVITVTNSRSLKAYLEQQFPKPLLFQSTRDSRIGAGLLSWEDFWDFLRKDPQKTIDVYDYSIVVEAERTVRRRIEDVIKHWEQPRDSRTALNCLDIENRLAQCCPLPIVDADLHGRTLQHGELTVGKANSSWGNARKEFCILSTDKAISVIHADTAAQLTFLYVIHGRKVIYFPRRIDLNAARLLARVGSEYIKGYDGGWAKVELKAGDLFVMPPSCPHAVYTPDDCLLVGGHFYTSAHLPRTLEALRLQEENPQISNEDLENKHYEVLTRIFNKFDEIGTADEIKQAWAACQIFLDSRSRPKLPEKRKDFIKALIEFSKRVDKSFENEPE
ncbi:uncharacterized protein BJX67DRAFT_356715 [Aspergillus lucknowensis]|uniref:[histone H3]-dimethyl-L-lysine(36) demethylase n=1 Tax=Aspergillus lucknowensis TaxID=176173 RepID=A0ABR4LNS0_9EURO